MASTNHTSNYNLPQWVKTDAFKMEDFNDAFQKIDTEIKGAKDAASAASTAAANAGKVAAGTYRGSGNYGQSNPNSLTFPFQPKLVIILGFNHSNTISYQPSQMILMQGYERSMTIEAYAEQSNGYGNPKNYVNFVSWSGNDVSWYSKYSAQGQLNYSNVTYRYLAIG